MSDGLKIKGAFEKEGLEFFNGDELRLRVFIDKYALKDEKGNVLEKTPAEMWRRVAKEIASVEETREKRIEWEKKFYWMLENFRFVPGGRIMFGAGQKGYRKATLLNCYVLPIKEDSIEAIWDCAKEMARTYSYGGGVGIDISILRPRGSPVHNSALHSTGAVSFMDLFSQTTGIIGQTGRRGALMITLRVDHPDVLDFIDIKNDPERRRVRYANISLRVTNDFMRAVERNSDITLWFENDVVGRIEKKVKAREIWKKLIKNARDSAEPGVIFWDTTKRFSTTEYNGMEVMTTNPCSEIPLEPYGCCCLGNVNLAKFVLDPFNGSARVNWAELERVLRYSVRFLDNVLTYSSELHPLKAQKEASLKSRRIGVGFTGLGDMLVKLNLKYDTDEALHFIDDLFNKIKNIVYDESVNLAIEKGTFQAFNLEKHLKSEFIKNLDKRVIERIKKHGIRNAALLTVPPVGSGSILAGTTSGIEPIFALSYIRRSESLTQGEFKVYHPLVKEYMENFGLKSEEELPETFVTAHEIKPEFRVKFQATIQKHIDHSISSTVNLPEDITEEEVEKIYFLAWKLGCKGITVYREGSREGILITEKYAHKGKVKPKERPMMVTGTTQKIKTGYGNMYVTINEDDSGIFEVFVTMGKSGGYTSSFTEALGRLISVALRSGVDPNEIVEHLRGIRSPQVIFDNGDKILSIPDGIAKAIERHLNRNAKVQKTLDRYSGEMPRGRKTKFKILIDEGMSPECPECNYMVIYENGCVKCPMCGWTQC